MLLLSVLKFFSKKNQFEDFFFGSFRTLFVSFCYLEIYCIGQTNPGAGCNTRSVCLYNTNAYFLQMAAGGERKIESN